MDDDIKSFRVGLILYDNCNAANYEYTYANIKYSICFDNQSKYRDLVITDKEPSELINISLQCSDCHGSTIVINKISSALLENQYETIFKKGRLKYKTLNKVTEDGLIELINSELIKNAVKENNLHAIHQLFNKHTRKELIFKLLKMSLLLIPFAIIIVYIFIIRRYTNFNFLCWFVDYGPNCKQNILEELKLLALIYSIFNLTFFYDYILKIFDNINNDIFQFSAVNKTVHNSLQFITPIILFLSSLIIVKALFVFKYSFRIAKENSFINIGDILNNLMPYLKDESLIYYFTALDCCLWLITWNFFRSVSQITQTFSSNRQSFSSNRQSSLIKSAKKSFGSSILFDVTVIIAFTLLFDIISKDPQSKLAFQLIFLQAYYLFMNIITSIHDFKFE